MKPFMDENFLLTTPAAQALYHDYAKKLPVLDYHCHIDPKEIAQDRRFENISQLWLGGDHYKWRAMRANGIEEKYITGSADDREKFQKWAETLPKLIGNPLYHWSHLELRNYFGYHGYLNGDTAEEVWQLCSRQLQQESMSARGFIRQSAVTLICTTDDPVDTLEWHKKIAADPSFQVQVLPAWRPDQAMNVEKPSFSAYITKLSDVSGVKITDFASLKEALRNRMAYFASCGCRVSDHALEYVMHVPASLETVNEIMAKGLRHEPVTKEEALMYKTAFLLFAAGEYHRLGWVMQLHFGCKRDNNGFMFKTLGPDTGFDCINDHTPSAQLADFFNALSLTNKTPKTILYSLNPNDNTSIETVIGCFQNSDAKGKLQHGSAWWFNDHRSGMTEQLTTLASLGCLGNFIGMLTDSRSFLSYTRHEYFRRILCEVIGGWVEHGEYPADWKSLQELVEGISYNNAVKYFGFEV